MGHQKALRQKQGAVSRSRTAFKLAEAQAAANRARVAAEEVAKQALESAVRVRQAVDLAASEAKIAEDNARKAATQVEEANAAARAAEAKDVEQEAARIAVEVDKELRIPATPACDQIPKTIPSTGGKLFFARMPAVVTHSECDTVLFGSNNIALTRRSGSDSGPGASNSED